MSLGYSQQFEKLSNAKIGIPTVIFNGNIIGNLKLIDSTQISNIRDIEVIKYLKDEDLHKNKIPNLGEYGIINIKYEEPLDVKTLAEINNFFNLPANNPIYIDGYLIKNIEYKIATKSIFRMEKLETKGEFDFIIKVIDVWTLNESERKGSNVGCSLNITKSK